MQTLDAEEEGEADCMLRNQQISTEYIFLLRIQHDAKCKIASMAMMELFTCDARRQKPGLDCVYVNLNTY
jgi:hypothetical protein